MNQKQIEGMEDPPIPDEVKEAAEEYDSAHKAKGKAAKRFNNAKTKLLEAMEEHGVDRVKIRNGEKYLEHEVTDKINYKKPEDLKPKLRRSNGKTEGFTEEQLQSIPDVEVKEIGLTDTQLEPLAEAGISTASELGEKIDSNKTNWFDDIKGLSKQHATRIARKLDLWREDQI